jgi:hypothetical protein
MTPIRDEASNIWSQQSARLHQPERTVTLETGGPSPRCCAAGTAVDGCRRRCLTPLGTGPLIAEPSKEHHMIIEIVRRYESDAWIVRTDCAARRDW